ncbi:MAG: cytidylate kinase-like family protein [Eubacteriales bacterium]|nr:cytidylate kinase-like family protein [Eubacteriales bacterium]
MADKKYIVTITRQFGSLGRPIAREMSELLKIEYYDRDIVEATSKKMNLPVSKISEHEETYSTNLFSMLLPLGSDSIAKQDEIYNVQKEVIREMAEKESCIIVGRCADYIFRDRRNVLNIYIYAPVDARYKNCVEVLRMKPEEATKMIYKVDKARTAYHRRYAKYAPGDPDSKQIMIDSSMLGVKGTAEVLAEIVQRRFGL